MKDLAALYGCEPSLAAIEQYRQTAGLAAISEKCFDAANIEFVLLDDGLTMDKMVSLGWHRKYIPGVHRVLRIETVAEAILNQASVTCSLTVNSELGNGCEQLQCTKVCLN